MENIVKLNPTVCVVGKTYQIIIISEAEALISVRVGEKVYYNHSNGIRISAPGVHKFSVPTEELDREKSYTVTVFKMLERLPNFPKTELAGEKTYNFRPIEKTTGINICHLADVHGMFSKAVNLAKTSKKEIDLLIMNGDISDNSNIFNNIILCYKIASELTKGEFPCIISRGNHDLRGFDAENLAKYMPDDGGKSYYTFKTGCIWGILVDTGEDKEDSHEEYNGTICCHEFRLEEEKMIKKVIENSSEEYAADDVKYRMVISHVPFTFKRKPPFDIERELYSSWSKLMKDNIKPHIMLCGHTHKACISECGSQYDDLGQPCTIVVGSNVSRDEAGEFVLAGAFVELCDNSANVTLSTENEVLFEEKVDF